MNTNNRGRKMKEDENARDKWQINIEETHNPAPCCTIKIQNAFETPCA
jgi:hypothetical protein